MPELPPIELFISHKGLSKYAVTVEEVRERFKSLSYSQLAMMYNVKVVLESPVEENYAVLELDNTYSLHIEGTLPPRRQRAAIKNLIEQIAFRGALTVRMNEPEV